MLARIESLDAARPLGEVFVELEQSGENVILVFRRKADRVDFLLLFQRDDELVGVLQKQKKMKFDFRKQNFQIKSATHISGLVGCDADNVVVRPSVGQVELVGIVSGDAVRADGENSLVLPLPGRVLGDQKALQFNILMYFARCSHYLSLRGAICVAISETTTKLFIFSSSRDIRSESLLFLKLSIRKIFAPGMGEVLHCLANFGERLLCRKQSEND